MKIEKNKLVNRAQVLNQDIQLGIIAYSVAEMASIIEQMPNLVVGKLLRSNTKL